MHTMKVQSTMLKLVRNTATVTLWAYMRVVTTVINMYSYQFDEGLWSNCVLKCSIILYSEIRIRTEQSLLLTN
jgi:hypothetical protein